MFRYYQRVSTTKQNLDTQAPDLQRHAADVEANGGQVKLYSPDKFTGQTLARPVITRLLAELRSGDTLVVWRLDRLGRTTRGLVNLIDDLRQRGVYFVSLRDGINTADLSPTQNLLLNLLISVAVFETEVRQERINAALAAKRARGEVWQGGRPKNTPDKLKPDVVALVKRLKDERKPVARIARMLSLSRGSVYKALRS
jgi:DNA invertase Pin-like site-specific DNA recombinase